VHVSAKADYALRALLQIAASEPEHVTMADIVNTQKLPRSFAEAILPELRRADFLRVWRGGTPAYSLARPGAEITVGSVIHAIDGPFTRVRGLPPEEVSYPGAARRLSALWLATGATLDRLLNGVTLADVISGFLPADIVQLPDRARLSTWPDATTQWHNARER
jgi:Rrf2 family protein